MTKKVEENWVEIYKRNPQRFLFSGDPSSSEGSHPRKMYVHSDFCQLLQVSNCLPLGTISNLPKHLGLLALSKD